MMKRLLFALTLLLPAAAWGQSLLPGSTVKLPLTGGTITSGAGSESINLYPTIPSGGCVAGVTTPSCGFSIVYGYDPSADGGASLYRLTQLLTTLTAASTPTDTFQNMISTIYLAGTGAYTNEVDGIVSYIQLQAGATVSNNIKTFEGTYANYGTLQTGTAFDVTIDNYAGATVTGQMNAYTAGMYNFNTTAGSVNNYTAFTCATLGGGGSLPTNEYCLNSPDPNQQVTIAGHLKVGSIGLNDGNITPVEIIGPDTSSSTFPLDIKNSAGTNVFLVGDNGAISASLGITLGVAGTTGGNVTLVTNVSGESVKIVSGTGTSGNTVITVPQSTATTLAGLAVVETFTANQTFSGTLTASGTLNVTGTLESGGTAGVSCTAGTVNTTTTVVSGGVVTHC